MAEGESYQGGLADENGYSSKLDGPYRNFVAFEHSVSPQVLLLIVRGQVAVGNPGIKAVLSYAEPQGTNPKILVLNLMLVQRPGVWPQVGTWVPASYSEAQIKSGVYSEVQINSSQLGGLTIPVFPV